MVVVDGVEMVDVNEAARLAHRTPETVRRWVWSRRLGAIRSGNRLLLVRSEVLSLTAPSTAQASASSLTDWVQGLRAAVPRGGAGATASDLVLDDRTAREETRARR